MYGAHPITPSSLMRLPKGEEFLTKVAAINKFVEHIHRVLHQAKEKLVIAQNRQKQHADAHRREVVFEVGDHVKPLEITFPNFLHDNVVPLLKYLDTKREKYIVRKEYGSYVELIRNRTKLKSAVAVKREWDSAMAMAKERAASLADECVEAKATLQEREDQLQAKEMECELLQLSLAKESGQCVELEETCSGLCVSNENAQKMIVDLLERLEKFKEAYEVVVRRLDQLITTTERREKIHAEPLAKAEARIVEEVQIFEELQGKIAKSKTAEEELRSTIAEIASKCDKEFQRAEEVSASLSEGIQKHEEELTNWAKKLANCELARSSAVECKGQIGTLTVTRAIREDVHEIGRVAKENGENREDLPSSAR
ncbi:hypothetical protein AXG93_4031s1520 [Marchantia polymorpha subsp. ruderalis]|uniref:Uncharacterized protein n=1 Tax=Marchantia polymorpha subsp. ruderalis TaxID=1480154 RepID=A0A176WDE7_MARPO|nr:hypothetical protein AXG93_4031s1520 [Marchantia polymorpha subsp. ruderalis]